MALRFKSARRIDRQLAVFSNDAVGDGACALSLRHQTHGFVFDQFGDGETVVHLGEGKIVKPDAGFAECALPCDSTAFELEDVAPRHRQEILHMFGGAEHDRLLELQRRLDIREDQSGSAVGDE
jgi:hypothetical protein